MRRTNSWAVVVFVSLAAGASSACNAPEPTTLRTTTGTAAGCAVSNATAAATSGPPHHLVFVEGANLFLSQVVWDAGTPAAKVIPGSLFGGEMFSVPHDATVGVHAVALQNAYGSISKTFNVQVIPADAPFQPPRIDHLTLTGARFDGSGNVEAGLYLSGANVDVGAIVYEEIVTQGEVTRKALPSFAHKGVHTDLDGVRPSRFGYPICHYLSLFAVLGPHTAGSVVRLVVGNLDGQHSSAFTLQLPQSAATLDSDGDSLLDAWETGGYDENGDGVVDVNLAALGAKPFRRDILLELDIMSAVQHPVHAASLDAARAMFAAAPVLNPVDENGINLILETGTITSGAGSVIFDRAGTGVAAPNPSLGTATFSSLKQGNFQRKNAGKIFHYGIWARSWAGHLESGTSDIKAYGSFLAGDDFLIGMDWWIGAKYHEPRSQAEILAHELGHNLGQRHGGTVDSGYAPNHLSVMSYSWTMRAGWPLDSDRIKYPTCTPLYYATPGAKETGGQVPSPINASIRYSWGMAKPLIETALDEAAGVCGDAVDWNPSSTSSIVTADVNHNQVATDTVSDFANWPALRFEGPAKEGSLP
jgi:hypothetical protein